MKHTAEIKVEKQVTITLNGDEFDALLQMVRYTPYLTHEWRGLVDGLYRVDKDLRKQYQVHTGYEAYGIKTPPI